MDKLREMLLKNRYTVLVATLALYMAVLVIEGVITDREARVIHFDNPFVDLEPSREAMERMRDEGIQE